ncbi:MAG: hypothetical protein B7X95_05275 [Methylophilaceae bacterium 17-44-8]|nr:MAG: hypothetical protein B7X95_05275 [Methylophilaceae bacterium 17-44-8]
MKPLHTLATAKKNAHKSTTFRGHRMSWGEPFGNATSLNFGQIGTCRDCKAEAIISTHYMTHGDALAIHCE